VECHQELISFHQAVAKQEERKSLLQMKKFFFGLLQFLARLNLRKQNYSNKKIS